MTYKTILLHVDDQANVSERTRLAVNLALAFDAHLMGLYAVDHFPLELKSSGPIVGRELDQLQRETLRRLREKAAAIFHNATSAVDLSSEWLSVGDDPLNDYPLAAVCAQARCADVVVIGASDPDDRTLGVPQDFPEMLCLAVGRPVLVVPYAGSLATAGERIVIGWNASRESARAVADALPLLKQAKQVDAVTITSQQNAAQRDSTSAGLIRYLGGHGVNANAINAHAAEKDVGDQLLSRALDRGADLLVMGAYGHSRFRELVLGGATRAVLRRMSLPVLMSH